MSVDGGPAIPTPLADRVLRDPVGLPEGVEQMLRSVERKARALHHAVSALAVRPDAVEAVRRAHGELESFLHDEFRSPFLRTLRRSLRQVAPGTPASRVLRMHAKGLFARAQGALDLQVALDRLNTALSRLRDRFGDELPRALREALRRERLTDEHVAQVRRASDVAPMLRRLARAESELVALETRLPARDDLVRGSWDEDVAPGELLACLELRLRERARLVHERDRTGALRALNARHVAALAAGAPAARPARLSGQAFTERVAGTLVSGEAHTVRGEDLPLWGELLGAATDALYAPGLGSGWAPRLPGSPNAPEESDSGTTRFVVAIDDSYALITPALASGVRLSGRSVGLGRTVECVVFLEGAQFETMPVAWLDVAPLFSGLCPEPAWYSTGKKAQLRVIGQLGDEWIARLERRGTLRPHPIPAWEPEGRGEGRLRVLGTLSAPPARSVEVGRAEGEERGFCGIRTTPVVLPFAECSRGWLRSSGGDRWADEALEAETTFFHEVARRVPYVVPTSAGRGVCRSAEREGPLFVVPLGLRMDESPPLARWLMHDDTVAQVRAVARLWAKLRQVGYGLGVYHPGALVFRTGWSERSGAAQEAHVVATDAPFGVRLGHYYRRPPHDDALLPEYDRLGCRVLPTPLLRGEVALPETEAMGFALFVLNLLARAPLPVSGVVRCEQIAEMVPDLGDRFFGAPTLAARMAAGLSSPAEAARLIERIESLAQPS